MSSDLNMPRQGLLFGLWKRFVTLISWEWLLRPARRANGCAVILLRASLITLNAYLVVLAIALFSNPTRSPDALLWHLRGELHDTIFWVGPIFAGIYALLHQRFSSQCLYLATLYNEIKAIEARTAGDTAGKAGPIIKDWKAGFLHDAN